MRLLTLLLAAVPLSAAEKVLVLDPARTQIGWSLGATMHTVHGTFQLHSATVRFDPATGKATGSIVVDARSGQSGNPSRDEKMHREILESGKYSDIVFTPDRVDGALPAQGAATLQVHGVFKLLGAAREFTLPVQVTISPQQTEVTCAFRIPYVAWGVKNPSTFLLRVSDNVEIEFRASGRISEGGGQ
jgi:polyisoprenoid-binding protein YceI